jgi:hypothetical protein
VQELLLEVRAMTEDLAQQLGRAPADSELAARLGVTEGDTREARQADLLFSTHSLGAPLSNRADADQVADLLGEDDQAVDERRSQISRQIAHHVGKPGALGFDVTVCSIPEPGGPGDSQAPLTHTGPADPGPQVGLEERAPGVRAAGNHRPPHRRPIHPGREWPGG